MKTFTISEPKTLLTTPRSADCDQVTVEAARLKYRGLLPYALKAAYWAVRPGGEIRINDQGGATETFGVYSVPFNAVRQWTFKFLGRDTRLLEMVEGRMIRLERTTPVAPDGWSAGVVFSGADKEIPTLLNCLDGLLRQPELVEGRGEIAVCGPARDLSFLEPYPAVRYVVFETSPSPRVLIGAKKNALMEALSGPRLLVLHARVAMEPSALESAPREFDILAPNLEYVDAGRRVPYLSLTRTDAYWPGRMARRPTLGTRHVAASGGTLTLIEDGFVFVDAGAIMVDKRVATAVPFDPYIAWQEAEDIDWCARAWLSGFVCGLAPDCRALSATSKVRSPPNLGPVTPTAMRGLERFRGLKKAGGHLIERARGRR